jgi:hypothetical protein
LLLVAERFWGIDFSGGAAPWRETVRNPTVWLAEAILSGEALSLVTLQAVQTLPGAGSPFDRLVNLLRLGDYTAAAIDAPFSIPSAHLPRQTHAGLVGYVSALANGKGKPFPAGSDLIAIAQEVHPLAKPKPLRRCEQDWKNKGVNTRSTLWLKPRGGAPFAAACLALIARSARPCWPWQSGVKGLLVEAFPAAQLKQWDLPHQGYNGPEGAGTRAKLVEHLASRIDMSTHHARLMLASADALDAVLAVFAGVAVSSADRTVCRIQ